MKVLIRRASESLNSKTAPVKGAKREKYTWIERRAFETFEAYDATKWGRPFGGPTPWVSQGENHRIVDGKIERDMPGEAWFVEVPDVWAFVKEHGMVVLGIDEGVPELTIYDSYLE